MIRRIWIQRLLIFTLIASLLLACSPALGEGVEEAASTVLTIHRAYEVTGERTMVYHDGAFQQPWGTLPAGMLLQVERLSSGFVTVTMRGHVGYIADNATRPLQPGDRLYATRNTRVYKQANVKSKYIEVPRGTDVTFVAMSGVCVQVTRNGVTGFMTIRHLGFLSETRDA